MNINYIHEPTDLQCGQAVLAMLLGTSAEYICEYLGNDRETDLKEMKRVLTEHGINSPPSESRLKLPQTSHNAHFSALKLRAAGTGHSMRTVFSTTPSMVFCPIFRSRNENSIGRSFPKQ